MNARVLFVDDEANILLSLKRVFQNEPVEILTAECGEAALAVLREHQVAVIVSDNMMPGMNGIEFLARSKDMAPECVRILMTGYADMKAAIDSINRGGVFRFITKPWNDDELIEAVASGVERYTVAAAMRDASEATLLSLAQTIELKDPYTRGHCDRVARYALGTAARLNLSEQDRRFVKQGSWLHDCGKIGVPESILNSKVPLTTEQIVVMKNHPAWGADVARLAKLPDHVVGIILHHHERLNGTGYPTGLKGPGIPYLAMLVAVADVYDAMTTDRPYRKAISREKAREELLGLSDSHFDPKILRAFIETV